MTSPFGIPLNSRAWVEVDLQAICNNFVGLSSAIGREMAIMAVVKADGYGHGLVPVAGALVGAGASWLGVASISEGAVLREQGISVPIALLCSPCPDDAETVLHFGLTPMVGDHEYASALANVTRRVPLEVHLDIDTGMGRSGVLPENAVTLWRQCVRNGLVVSGICTHFADADGGDPGLTLDQWRRFQAAKLELEAAGAKFRWSHARNSAAIMQYRANGCNLARPGMLLYGLIPTLANFQSDRQFAGSEFRDDNRLWGSGSLLEAPTPALALRARISSVRNLPAGHTISYGAACKLPRPSLVATVLVGYGDGYPRRLSSCGEMLIRGQRAPILGRICMDQTVVDVTEIPGVKAGDIATCIGSDGNESIRAESIAKLIDSTDHEVTTCLTSRLPRIYQNGARSQPVLPFCCP